MKFKLTTKVAVCFGMLLSAHPAWAVIIGTNEPAEPLTLERISGLQEAVQPEWRRYLEKSRRQGQADRDSFLKEVQPGGDSEAPPPKPDKAGNRLPLKQPAAWYAGGEARRIADIVISFQTPAGGWSKNLDLTSHPRAPGELFNGDTASKHPGSSDFDAGRKVDWNYIGTFDNSATTTQLRFLAKVVSAEPGEKNSPARRAFLRGMDYILAAQYPNGGWPQVWPLQGGYHDAITFNDGAMVNVLQLLSHVAKGTAEFGFVPQAVRDSSAAAIQRGVKCILDTQILSNGRRTIWCQQHDALTLQPTSARNYEMPAQATGESAGIMLFLIGLPHPSPAIKGAVQAAAAWFEKTKLQDVAFRSVGPEGRQLVSSPGAGPLWARYYEIGSDRPIFGDRDKTIHDHVSELSRERRDGYSWFGESPRRALEAYHPCGGHD